MYPEGNSEQSTSRYVKHLKTSSALDECMRFCTHTTIRTVCVLTDETVHVLRVARVVWDCEASVADRHLALPEGKSEVAEFIQQTAHRLCRVQYQNTALKYESAPSVLLFNSIKQLYKDNHSW